MQWGRAVCAGVLVLAVAVGCSSRSTQAPGGQAVAQGAATLPAPVDALDSDGLRARAELALREQRIHAPAGNSAVDYYLALRERSNDVAGVTAALTELQPYVLIAAEQALSRDDLAEAQRLLGLLERIDAHAPALPRLREGLAAAQLRADKAETASLVAAMRMPEADSEPAAHTAAAPAPKAAAVDAAVTAVAAQALPAPPLPAPAAAMADETPTPAPAPLAERPLPRLLEDSAPRYPLAARNRRIEGSVRVAFTIQPDGKVSQPRLLSAQPAGVFDEAALAAAARWRFEATGQRFDTTRTLTFQLPPSPQG